MPGTPFISELYASEGNRDIDFSTPTNREQLACAIQKFSSTVSKSVPLKLSECSLSLSLLF
jgi:hypothetical protein